MRAGAGLGPSAPVFSFDVFDTLLTRRTGRPESVFDVMAERLSAQGGLPAPAAALTAARIRAEPRLHSSTGHPPTLRAVYEEVAQTLCLPPETVEVLVSLEEAVERELSVVVPGAAEMVTRARALHPPGAVLFVSDTPHTTDLLREFLSAQDLLTDLDHVFSSAEVGASKSRGGMFTAVAHALGRHPADFLHTGDNARADVAAARAEGWRAVHRPLAQLNRYEKLLDRRPDVTAGLGTRLAGASRLARTHAGENGVPAAIASVAAGVVAPVLIGYSIWLAAQARERGLTRLYFVARDGEVVLEVARPVLAVLAPQVECRYLYGSRQAWMVAGGALSDDVLASWLSPRAGSTLRSALVRAGLDVVDFCARVRQPWTDPARADARLSPERASALSELLQREPWRTEILATAREDVEHAVAYLRQEGFADGVAAGLVDLGWRGHSARAFDRLLSQIDGRPVHHLFLGLHHGAGRVRDGVDPPGMSAWLFDRDAGRAQDLRSLDRPNVVLETFCAGTEGRLLRYRREGERIVPVLTDPHNEAVLAWGLPQVRAVVAHAVQECARALREDHLHVDLARPAWDVLQAFWMRPTHAEAEAWGSFPWDEEGWPPVYPLAERLGHRAALRRILRRRRGLPVNSWVAGSTRLQARPWRSVLELRELQHHPTPRVARWRNRARLVRGWSRR